jgi:hypothetical protein
MNSISYTTVEIVESENGNPVTIKCVVYHSHPWIGAGGGQGRVGECGTKIEKLRTQNKGSRTSDPEGHFSSLS